MTSRILVATDLSEASAEAVRQADAYAKATGSELGVCHVLPNLQSVHMLFPQMYASEATAPGALEKLAADTVARSITELTGRAEDGFDLFLDEGSAYAEIVRRATEWPATVLFVGGHGATALSNVVLGTVAEKVVRYAHCAVVVARRPPQLGVVLVATDLSNPSLPAVHAAAEEARRRGAKLVAVHAIDIGAPFAAFVAPFGAMPVGPSPDVLRGLSEAARTSLAGALASAGAEGEAIVLEGSAAAVINQALETYAPELLVIATHGRTGLARVALGSVAERLVRTAHTSVLVVR